MFRGTILALVMLTGNSAWAANWHGVLESKVQIDNRISNDATISSEVWGLFGYDDHSHDFFAKAQFMARVSDFEDDDEQMLYQLYIDKGFDLLHSRFKLGRMERSDNQGFYLLDGLDVQVQNENKTLSLNLYGGKPSRIDHDATESGELVYGAKLFLHKELNWQQAEIPITLDRFDLRIGMQSFEDQNTAQRINLGANIEGKINFPCCDQSYQLRGQGTYRYDADQLENWLIEGQWDINQDWRIRSSYQMYDPNQDITDFRKQFYATMAEGKQTLFRGEIHYQVLHNIRMRVSGLKATREDGDPGYGAQAGLQYRPMPNTRLDLDLEYIEYIEDTIESALVGLRVTPTSRLDIRVNGALRREKKQMLGEQFLYGLESEFEYFWNNHLKLSLDMNYIWNSRLNDEYVGRFQITHYFDNFKPKEK